MQPTRGVTFLQVRGQRIGISGTQELFTRWLQAGREPAELSAADACVRAIRDAYTKWRAREKLTAQGTTDAQG